VDGERVPVPEGSAGGGGRRQTRPKRAPGPTLIERSGFWHVHGTVREGRSSGSIRKSTGLPATEENRAAAEKVLDRFVAQKHAELRGDIVPIATAIACDRYLNRIGEAPPGHREIAAAIDVEQKFGRRVLSEIAEAEWQELIDRRQAGNSLSTRQRYITALRSFLNWCKAKKRRWLAALPELEYHKKYAAPKQRRARRVGDLSPELIMLMIEHAAPHMKVQLVAEWCTGARVSSILYHCRVCDVILVEGHGQITFHDTKNDDPVVAALNDWAVGQLLEYARHRGNLEDREGPFFLTDEGVPYVHNGKAWGGQNKSAFNGMKRRTVKAIRSKGAAEALDYRRQGERPAAWAAIARAKDQARLVGSVTQHWFRHLLATTMQAKGDLRSVMEQGGWRDVQSVIGYTHDVPSHRRQLVDALPIGPQSDAPEISASFAHGRRITK
jgi:site-specific recombinase XerD